MELDAVCPAGSGLGAIDGGAARRKRQGTMKQTAGSGQLDSTWVRLAVVAAFAAAMAVCETVTVFYLERLLGGGPRVPGFRFPEHYLTIERAREAATMVMLLAVGFLAGPHWRARAACFLFAFGIWDIGYYIALHALTGWPTSLDSRDLLFLIPGAWWGPVWEPLAVSSAFIAVALALLALSRRGSAR
jgi:hypothetical protein